MERANHGVPCGTCMGDTWHMGGPSVMPLGLHELGGGGGGGANVKPPSCMSMKVG